MRGRIAVAVAGLLAACVATPGGAPPPLVRVEVHAPIVRVSVRFAESLPAQYFADVTSALPDGCTEFARFALRREGATLFVDVFNTRPASSEIACTMIYGEVQTAVPLGDRFTPGATYSLDVNGTRETFRAQ